MKEALPMHPETDIDQTFIKLPADPVGDAGDPYTGLDRFGRIAEIAWIEAMNSIYKERLQFARDRVDNITSRANLLNSDLSENYTNDDLSRLTDFARADGHEQSFDMNANGGFNSVTTDGDQIDRTNDAQNQITSIEGGFAPTYDANGNLTMDEIGQKYISDAWNRLVRVTANDDTPIMDFAFDALGRRVIEDPGTVKDLYFDGANVIEERMTGSGSPFVQFVWNPLATNTLVLRDRDTDDNSTLDERLYAIQDANNNVTAFVGTDGNVVERYAYDPYGVVRFLDSNWNVISASAFASNYLFQNGRFDAPIGNYRFGEREYRPTIQVWTSHDSIWSENLYRYVRNNPTNATDPSGLEIAGPGYNPYGGGSGRGPAPKYFKDRAEILEHLQNMPLPNGSTEQERTKAVNALNRLLDTADANPVAPANALPNEKCASWVEKVLRDWSTNSPLDEKDKSPRNKFYKVESVYWSIGGITIGAGGFLGLFSRGNEHATIRVTFTDNRLAGFYLDNGWLAGSGEHLIHLLRGWDFYYEMKDLTDEK